MEVKKNYKQTDVGAIPEDWDVQLLHELSEKIMVGIASAATHAYRTQGVPLLRNQNIKKGYLADDDLLFVDEGYETIYKNKRLKTGDLLTARTGYPGTTCIIPSKYDGAQCFTTLITRLKKDAVDANYLCHYINSEYGLVFIEKSKIGGGQKNIGVGIFQKMPVPIPKPSEQQAIAAALSDVDALLTSLDALIAKKRLIKQGAMQELLTGKRRLKGFGWEWQKKKLGEILTLQYGKSQHGIAVEGGKFPILATGGEVGRTNSYLYDKPSIILGRKGTIDIPRYVDVPFWTIDTAYYSQISEQGYPKFLY